MPATHQESAYTEPRYETVNGATQHQYGTSLGSTQHQHETPLGAAQHQHETPMSATQSSGSSRDKLMARLKIIGVKAETFIDKLLKHAETRMDQSRGKRCPHCGVGGEVFETK